MNVVCFPHAGGNASTFHFLKKEKAFHAVPYEYPAHGSRIGETPYRTFAEAVRSIAEHLLRMNAGETILLGHSMGAYIAFEVACFMETYYDVSFPAVIVSGQVAPHFFKKSSIQEMSDRDFAQMLQEMGGMEPEAAQNRELLECVLPVIRSDYMLLDTYQPDDTHSIRSPLYVFTGGEDDEVCGTDLCAWKHWTETFRTIRTFPGNHFYIRNNQEQIVSALKTIMNEERTNMEERKYAWAPSVDWEILKDGRLRIAGFVFQSEYASLFPVFYDTTAQGATRETLADACSHFPQKKLHRFIDKLEQTEILLHGLQPVDALFFSQEKLYGIQHPYDEELRIHAEKLNAFQRRQLARGREDATGEPVVLAKHEPMDELLAGRRSCRTFDPERAISFPHFSGLLSCLMQRQAGEEIRYCYPSAGGLYPIDIYLYIKEGRVEGVKQGLYAYNPHRHELTPVSDRQVDDSCQYYPNKAIFNGSAFSVYLVYHADASMPKYGGAAYFYGMVESGIILELLGRECERFGIGSCIIGDMDFRSIRPLFALGDNDMYLISAEFGYKPDPADRGQEK